MLLLMWVTRRFEDSRKRGDVFLIYLIFYPLVRFSLDFLRLDASEIGGININQTFGNRSCDRCCDVDLAAPGRGGGPTRLNPHQRCERSCVVASKRM
jgi:hypothetical protein